MAPPHPNLTREEAVLFRQLESNSLFTPVIARHVYPEVYLSDVCPVCKKARATTAHILWDCEVNRPEANEDSAIPPELQAAARSEYYETQLKAV